MAALRPGALARPAAIALMGPTASGKTALALALAEQGPFELISVDSALVYRGMDIGSAKPDARTLARWPHRLVDICEPVESYSAARFAIDALAAMEQAHANGRVPLLVGGTMLYFRALLDGLSEMPDAEPELRAQIEAEAAGAGWPALHAQLAEVDPVAAARIHPNDPQRIGRALEVYRSSGQPISRLQTGGSRRIGWRVLKLGVMPPSREELHRRIALRLDEMLAQGFLAEVERLRARGDLNPSMPSMRAVGYRQAWAHLEGETDTDTFRTQVLCATRQLAKRQITWLRRELDVFWIDPMLSNDSAILRVREFLGPGA